MQILWINKTLQKTVTCKTYNIGRLFMSIVHLMLAMHEILSILKPVFLAQSEALYQDFYCSEIL